MTTRARQGNDAGVDRLRRADLAISQTPSLTRFQLLVRECAVLGSVRYRFSRLADELDLLQLGNFFELFKRYISDD